MVSPERENYQRLLNILEQRRYRAVSEIINQALMVVRQRLQDQNLSEADRANYQRIDMILRQPISQLRTLPPEIMRRIASFMLPSGAANTK